MKIKDTGSNIEFEPAPIGIRRLLGQGQARDFLYVGDTERN